MRAYWILPNRDQKDEIPASDGETVLPLRQILDPKLRPEGFSHGVPTELLEKCGPKAFAEILFAQRFPAGNGGKELFSLSSTAGLDSSGRVVHIGLLFLLEPQERPRFELPYPGLSEEDRVYARALIHRMKSPGNGDAWVQCARPERTSVRQPAGNECRARSFRRPVPFALCGRPRRIDQEVCELEDVAHDRDYFADSLRSRGRVAFCPRLRTILAARSPDWSGDMAFQLKANESVSDGIRRNVRRQIEKALDHVDAKRLGSKTPGAKRKPHQRAAPENEAVRDVRKCFKTVRAALQRVREDLGDDLYHEENFCFRDAARPLTHVRDAEVLVETADKLTQQFPGAIEPGAFAKIQEALLGNRQEVTRRVLDEDKAFDAVKDFATRAL